jgi:tetratricopeptide (TPR) repeat protein
MDAKRLTLEGLALATFVVALALAGPHPDSRTPRRAPHEAAILSPPTVEQTPVAIAMIAPQGEPPAIPVPMPTAVASAAISPARHRRLAHSPRPPDADDDAEANLLAQALQLLHRHHDTQGALSLLESHASRFPHGQLSGEVALVRAEALLRLGRRQELVEQLDPEATKGLPRAAELSLLRAEVLSQLGRCNEAIPGFSALLGGALEARLRERALFGRALCYAAGGRASEAREDLARVLEEFPAKRARVLQTLEGLPP